MPFLRFRGRAGGVADDAAARAFENLLAHIPAEASTLYVAGLDAIGPDASVGTVTVVAVVSLVVLLLVRILFHAERWVLITSVVAFVLWVYALGHGPFQAIGLALPQGLGAFFILAFHAIVTIIATVKGQKQ